MKIPRALCDQMIEHVNSCYPEEACGILGGIGEEASLALAVENELHSPVRFCMRAAQQLEALMVLEEKGLELTGIWHSHPGGPPHLSPTDLAEAYYPEAALLVWSPGTGEARGWQLNAFRLLNGRVVDEEITIV